MRETLILDHPDLPFRAGVRRRDGARPVRDRVRRVGAVTVELATGAGWRWIESQQAVGVEVEFAVNGAARRPAVVRHPAVGARLERQRLRLSQFALALEMMGKPRRL